MCAALITFELILVCWLTRAAEGETLFSGEMRLNNLVSVLLEVPSISESSQSRTFTRSNDGWIFISARSRTKGMVRVFLNNDPRAVIVHNDDDSGEAMRYVTHGEHTIRVECQDAVGIDKLVVKAIPELIHCGLGFNPEIKSYGVYD